MNKIWIKNLYLKDMNFIKFLHSFVVFINLFSIYLRKMDKNGYSWAIDVAQNLFAATHSSA